MPSLPSSNKRRPWQPAPPKREYQAHAERTHLYDTPRWRRVRLAHLKAHPLCVHCQAQGLVVPAIVLDHIKPYNEGGDFWDSSNHQGLCTSHHAKKSASERHHGNRGGRGSNPQTDLDQ